MTADDKQFLANFAARVEDKRTSHPAWDKIPGGPAGALLIMAVVAFLAKDFYSEFKSARDRAVATEVRVNTLEITSAETLKAVTTLADVVRSNSGSVKTVARDAIDIEEEIRELREITKDRYSSVDAAEDFAHERQETDRADQMLERLIASNRKEIDGLSLLRSKVLHLEWRIAASMAKEIVDPEENS